MSTAADCRLLNDAYSHIRFNRQIGKAVQTSTNVSVSAYSKYGGVTSHTANCRFVGDARACSRSNQGVWGVVQNGTTAASNAARGDGATDFEALSIAA